MSRLLTEIFVAVAQMAKIKKWRDVRLLSFDLQTVEFAYSSASHPRPFWSSTYLLTFIGHTGLYGIH
jgi:hypothetical protein